MNTLSEKLELMLKPIVESMQFEFVGLEYLPMGHSALLRVYIDHEQGINVEHCADVSRQLSAVLDIEDPIAGEYTLEVSSPGIERPLFTKEHFNKFIGFQAKIVLLRADPENNRKKYKGQIVDVVPKEKETMILLEVDKEVYHLALNNIKKANLVAEF
jgi:ribosome maturation factor RimP